MKIYTRKGDTGQTGLLGGTRVSKDDLRIEAYGTVDELNAWIGMLATAPETQDYHQSLAAIQHALFVIGSHLANDPAKSTFQLPPLAAEATPRLEAEMDAMEETVPPLKQFVLPGGHPVNAQAHLARTVCRRAERRVVGLHRVSPVDELLITYLNRLSDWLFMLARYVSQQTQSPEIPWIPQQ